MRQDGKGSADELLAFQRLAWSTIVFSVTRRCPLRCSHCITESGPERHHQTLSATRAAQWARDLPALARSGVRRFTFTGGEPVLALGAVRVLAQQAAICGIRTGIVTSGAWASEPRLAARIVRTLNAISHWDFGYDEYHAESLSWDRFKTALTAVKESGASFSVRLCESDPRRTAELADRLRLETQGRAPVFIQPIRRLGRGAQLHQIGVQPLPPQQPCMSTGPFIREDGSTGPCCSGLAYREDIQHPFRYGNADTDGLLAIWTRWKEDQLLRLMRLSGLHYPVGWVDSWDRPPSWSNDVCESCVSLWSAASSKAAGALSNRASHQEIRAQLDKLERHLYGELWEERH